MKPVIWLGNSLRDIRTFLAAAKREIGYQLARVQSGLEPEDWKPMPSVGIGVYELRVHSDSEYRVLYIAKFSEAVYVLHAFQKKTQKTSKADIELARVRFRQLVKDRLTWKS